MKKIKPIISVFFLVGAAVFLHARILKADSYQVCEPGVDCVLGEFLFDDDYVPLTSDVCTIDVRNPSGTLVTDEVGTTFGNVDGWHGYTFNGTTPEGLYRALLCCTVDAEKACTDKSFMLQTPIAGSDPDAATQADITSAKADIIAEIGSSITDINSNVDLQTANLIVGSNPDAATKADLSSAKSDINANVDAAESGIGSKIDSAVRTLKSKINAVGDKISALRKKVLGIFFR